jgi:NAD(P)-dependent dehydrogenase (short-subunit alcohol dehydrogenase family)
MAAERSRTVLVTGASTGIGAATVQASVARGDRVWASVRRAEDAERLVAEHGDAVSVVRFDLTDAEAVADAGRRIVAAGPLDGVVANAGMAVPGPLEFMPVDLLQEQLDINVLGQLRVIQAVMPAIRAGSGRIVVVGSIAGRVAGPMLGAYHISKFALVALTDSLRAELAPWRIPVVLIEPGPVATPIWARSAAHGERVRERLPAAAEDYYGRQIERLRRSAERSAAQGIPVGQAAAVILRALADPRPRPRYLVGRDAKVGAAFARLPDGLRYRLTATRH